MVRRQPQEWVRFDGCEITGDLAFAESDGEELNKVKEQAICKLGELYAEQK
jgi:hypothetical protein